MTFSSVDFLKRELLINWRMAASTADTPAAKIQSIAWNKDKDSVIKSLDFINDRIANCKRWSATIDLVIFTDGVAVGKDTLHNLERIKARLDGERDVNEGLFKEIKSLNAGSQKELSARPDYSKLFIALEDDVYKSKLIVSKENEGTLYKWRQRMTGNVVEDNYNKGKLSATRNILLIRKNAGEEKAIDYIVKSMQSQRVRFYRELSNGQRVSVW
jgi:hypothetical protein